MSSTVRGCYMTNAPSNRWLRSNKYDTSPMMHFN